MKRRTNHEGQPRLQTSQLTDAVDTAGQKLTHPKVRESKQGDYIVAQRADTTPTDTGCRTQLTPASQPKQEKHRKKKGRVAAQPMPPGQQKDRPPLTEKAENTQGNLRQGSCANCRPRRKSTAQGREPSDAPKTPPTQQPGSTAGAGQLTGARKVAEPAKGKLQQGKQRWHKVEN